MDFNYRPTENNKCRLIFVLLFSIIKDFAKFVASKLRQRRRFIACSLLAITVMAISYRLFGKLFASPPIIKSSPASLALPTSGSIYCWILTSPQYFKDRVVAVNETWLSRCDRGEFFTTEEIGDPSIPHTTVFSGLDDGYYQLFWKTIKGFEYSYRVSDKFDWYLKADDDTFVIMEHLREYLSGFDPMEPFYIGYIMNPVLRHGYNSGGAGYILSRGAMKIFVEELANNRELCPYDIFEDLGMGRCLESRGILPMDTRNDFKQARFLPYSIKKIFETKVQDKEYIRYKERRRFEAFGKELISFHHQSPDELRMIEILLYRVGSPTTSRFHQPVPELHQEF